MKLVRFSNYFYGAATGTGFHQDRQPGTPCKPGGKAARAAGRTFQQQEEASKGGLAPAGRGRPISIFEIDDALLPYPVWAVRARLYKSFYKYMQS